MPTTILSLAGVVGVLVVGGADVVVVVPPQPGMAVSKMASKIMTSAGTIQMFLRISTTSYFS